MEFYLFGFVECKRWVDFYKPKSQAEPGSFFGFEDALAGSGENAYPGGIFVRPLLVRLLSAAIQHPCSLHPPSGSMSLLPLRV